MPVVNTSRKTPLRRIKDAMALRREIADRHMKLNQLSLEMDRTETDLVETAAVWAAKNHPEWFDDNSPYTPQQILEYEFNSDPIDIYIREYGIEVCVNSTVFHHVSIEELEETYKT